MELANKIIKNDKTLICDFCDIWYCMKCSRLSDEVHTLLAKSEVAKSTLRIYDGCNRAFPQANVMPKKP